jgi:predicted DNA-binding WGR domain protein
VIKGPILINSDGTSNKFWTYEIDQDCTVITKWGRVGTAGQTKPFKFTTLMEAEGFGRAKVEEKIGRGYHEVTEHFYELETLKAQIAGGKTKVERIKFISPAGESSLGKQWRVIDESSVQGHAEIADPDYKPHLWMTVIFSGDGGGYDLIVDPELNVLSVEAMHWFVNVGVTAPAFTVTGSKPVAALESPRLKKFCEKIPELVPLVF